MAGQPMPATAERWGWDTLSYGIEDAEGPVLLAETPLEDDFA
jgi:hypothetical protein